MTRERQAGGGNFGDRMAGYVEVADRIVAFYERYPEGSLQSAIYHLDSEIVVMQAWAYRTPDDVRPGIGWSSMLIPGSTPYTKGSEIENTETSAWGRAIAALGFEVRRGVASRDEISNKQEQRQGPPEHRERPIAPMQARRPPAGAVDAPDGITTPEALIQWGFSEHGLGVEAILTLLKIDGLRLNSLTSVQVARARTTILEKLGTPPTTLEVPNGE